MDKNVRKYVWIHHEVDLKNQGICFTHGNTIYDGEQLS